MATTLEAIRALLGERGVTFREVHHEATRTSEESARARGEPLEIGGKALVIKVDDVHRLFVLSAARSVDSAALKKHFGAKKIRFASEDELRAVTGMGPGEVPPFGRPIVDLDLHVDGSITANDRIAFNAGSLTDSIIMSVKDYLAAAQPELLDFSKAPRPAEESGGT